MKRTKKTIFIQLKKFSRKVLFTYFYWTLLLFFTSNQLSGQNSSITDSLENILKTNVLDSTRAMAYIQLFEIYYATDTAKANFYLSQLAKEIDAEKYEIPEKWIFEVGSEYHQVKNDFPNAIKYSNLAFQQAKIKGNNAQIYYECWLGYIYSSIGEHEKARKHLINAIETAENKKITKHLPFAYLVYAFEFKNTKEYDKSIINFTKSYEISKEIGDSTYIHTALHEIGNIYTMQNKFDLSIEYHKKALIIREKMNAPAYLMYSYNDIANDYLSLDSISEALNFYHKAEKIAKQRSDYFTLFQIYHGLVTSYSEFKNYNKAFQYLSEMQKIADEIQIKSFYMELYDQLYNYNRDLGNHRDALQYLELKILYKDSISSEEIQKNLNDLDKKYETVKKDKELIENQSHIKRQQIIILFTIIVLVVFAVFIMIVYRQYRQKREAFNKLEIQNQEILQQKEEILTQTEHLEQANAEITTQKNVIEKSHQHITASITYAKRIQEAILPKKDFIQMLIPEHFIFYKPRDIVSGDFYFIKLYKNILFVAAADCTGHGVPGAFMSMLGFALINELIRKPEIQNPAQLLE